MDALTVVRLSGIARNSGNQPLDGVLEVTADGRIYDQRSNSLILQSPQRFTVPDGDFSRLFIEGGMMNEVVDLVPSSRVSYHFRFFQVMKSFTYYDSEDRVWQGDTHEFQGAVYSGVSHGEDAQLLRVETRTTESDLIPSFHALLPYVSTVNFFDLLPTGATESNQDTSILSVATMIVTRPTLLQPIVEAVAKVISLDR